MRGGRREGAGLKKGHAPTHVGQTKTRMALYIDNDLVPYIRQQPNKAKFVNDAIREKIGRG